MTNVGIAFTILDDGVKPSPGWRKASGHLVFDVKMEFTRKARWVKDGHRTPDPFTSAYAGVVSRESVRAWQQTFITPTCKPPRLRNIALFVDQSLV